MQEMQARDTHTQKSSKEPWRCLSRARTHTPPPPSDLTFLLPLGVRATADRAGSERAAGRGGVLHLVRGRGDIDQRIVFVSGSGCRSRTRLSMLETRGGVRRCAQRERSAAWLCTRLF